MAEYINKEKMLKYLDETHTDNEWLAGQYNADWIYSFIESQPNADVVEVKRVEIIRDDLKWWLETNSEKGVVHIPKYVVENMIAKMDGRRDT